MKKIIIYLTLFTTLLSAERIERVIVKNKQIKPFLLLNSGEEYSAWKVYLSVKRAYATGIFQNIIVERKEGKQGIILIFKGIPKLIIKDIQTIHPPKFNPPSLLYLRKGRYVEEKDINLELKRAKKYLRNNGYFSGKVKYKIENGVIYIIYSPGQKFRISKIILNGKNEKKFYDLQIGDYYSKKSIEKVMKKTQEDLKQKGFLRARINIKETIKSRGVILQISVKKGKKFKIKITGYPVPLEVVFPFWERKYSKEWSLYEGKTAIKEYLLKKGIYVKEIEAEANEFEDSVEVVYELKGVGRLEGRKIIIKGNRNIPEKEIFKLLRGKPGLLTGIDLEKLRESLLDVREKYLELGFRDIAISWEVSRKGVIINIKEGRKFTIEKVSFFGNTKIPSPALLKISRLKKGMPFYAPGIYQAAQNIRNFYLSKGFRKFEVLYTTRFVGNKVEINFKIKEGIRPKLSLFHIIGNITKRAEKVIRDNLPFTEGNFVDGVKEDEGRMKLEVLGIFTLIEVNENIWDSKHMDIIVKAQQLPSYVYSFGVGWETRGGPRLSFVFSSRNLVFSPMLLNLSLLLGGSQRVVGLTTEMPKLFSVWDFRSSAVYERGNMTSYDYETSSIYFSLFRERKMGWDQISLRISRVELFNLQIPQSEVDREFLPSYITSLSYFYAIDQRDDPINPTKGWFFSASLEKYFSIFGTRVDGAKTYFHLQGFKPLGQNIIAMGVKFGLAKGNLPISERFFAGGPMSFRGEGLDRLSPVSEKTGMPLGGMGLAIINLEYRLPVYQEIYLVIFYDGGEVTRYMHELSLNKWENSIGLGLRYKTPFGPIRLEAGYNPSPSYGGKIKLFISLGEIL